MAEPPGGLTKDGDVARVTPERCDVGPDPAQCRQLIEQAEVSTAGVRRPANLREVEKPERSEPIVD